MCQSRHAEGILKASVDKPLLASERLVAELVPECVRDVSAALLLAIAGV